MHSVCLSASISACISVCIALWSSPFSYCAAPSDAIAHRPYRRPVARMKTQAQSAARASSQHVMLANPKEKAHVLSDTGLYFYGMQPWAACCLTQHMLSSWQALQRAQPQAALHPWLQLFSCQPWQQALA